MSASSLAIASGEAQSRGPITRSTTTPLRSMTKVSG